MPLVKVEEQVFSLLIFFNMADIVGTTVASQRWPAGGKPMAGRRWPADGGPTSASNGNVPPAIAIGSPAVDRWWQFAAYSYWRTDGVVLSGMSRMSCADRLLINPGAPPDVLSTIGQLEYLSTVTR